MPMIAMHGPVTYTPSTIIPPPQLLPITLHLVGVRVRVTVRVRVRIRVRVIGLGLG